MPPPEFGRWEPKKGVVFNCFGLSQGVEYCCFGLKWKMIEGARFKIGLREPIYCWSTVGLK